MKAIYMDGKLEARIGDVVSVNNMRGIVICERFGNRYEQGDGRHVCPATTPHRELAREQMPLHGETGTQSVLDQLRWVTARK